MKLKGARRATVTPVPFDSIEAVPPGEWSELDLQSDTLLAHSGTDLQSMAPSAIRRNCIV
jgi:hypothetical protein